MKGKIERINVVESLRLMIKQIAGPLQILSGAEVLLRVHQAVVSSIKWDWTSFCRAEMPPLPPLQ